MAIKSHAFGRVTLTGKDAKKFQNQAIYGKPSKAAVQCARRGVALSRKFDTDGKVSIVVARAKAGGGR